MKASNGGLTKRDTMRITVSDEGYVVTYPPALSIFAESEGYKPAEFDRLIEISGGKRQHSGDG